MKVKVQENKASITYPCLMEDRDGLIFYMLAEGKGVVINGDDTYNTGDYSESWVHRLEPFNGSITLSNN